VAENGRDSGERETGTLTTIRGSQGRSWLDSGKGIQDREAEGLLGGVPERKTGVEGPGGGWVNRQRRLPKHMGKGEAIGVRAAAV